MENFDSSSGTQLNSDLDDWAAVTTENLQSLPLLSLRALLYVLLGAIALIVSWSFLFQIEDVTKAKGKLEPQKKVTVLDAPVSGKVASVAIEEGDKVKKNQILLSFDEQLSASELEQSQEKLNWQQRKLKELKKVRGESEKVLSAREFESISTAAEKQEKISQALAVVNVEKSELLKSEIRFQGAKQKLKRYQKAHHQGALSKYILAAAAQLVKEEEQNIVQAISNVSAAEANYREAIKVFDTLVKTNKIKVIEAKKELAEINSQIIAIKSDIKHIQALIKGLNYQREQQAIKSPIDGVVFDLQVIYSHLFRIRGKSGLL